MIIELNEVDMAIAELISEGRLQADIDAGRTLHSISKIDPRVRMRIGAQSEVAVAKMLNLFPDTNVKKLGLFDLILGGKRIEVKTTNYIRGNLLVPIYKLADRADIYILTVSQTPVFTAVGFALDTDLFCHENIVDLGYGETYRVMAKDLKRMEDIYNA